MIRRREFNGATMATLVGALVGTTPTPSFSNDGLLGEFARLERQSGGRLGVCVMEGAGGKQVAYRGDERFPMCSTFKLLAAAAVLARVDTGREILQRRVAIEAKDILDYAPVTRRHVGGDGMSMAELCEAAVVWSDNSAGNLLLASIGGPSAFNAFAASLGDRATRLDRIEPFLNEAAPGDERDTTLPNAMASNVSKLTLGTALSAASRDQLVDWLVGCKTGDARLRAGLPRGWRVGDKTASGERGTANDVAVIWPANRPPLVIAAYLTGTTVDAAARDKVLADVGRAVSAAYR
jgi:beta-lactamase class A